MPEDGREVIRQGFQLFNDRDVDGLVALHADDVVLRLIGGFAEVAGAEFTGHAGVRRWYTEMIETLDSRGEIESMHDAGERLLVVVRVETDAARANTTLRYAQVCTFRDGLIAAVDNYYDVADAFEAVGLPAPDPT